MTSFVLRSRTRTFAQWIAVAAAVALVAAIAVSSYGASTADARLRPSTPARVTAIPRSKAALVRWTAAAGSHRPRATRFRVTPYVGKQAKAAKVVGAVDHTVIAGLKNGTT